MSRKELSASDRRAWHGEMRSDIKYESPEEKCCGEGRVRPAHPEALAPMHVACERLDQAVARDLGRIVCARCHSSFRSTVDALAHWKFSGCAE